MRGADAASGGVSGGRCRQAGARQEWEERCVLCACRRRWCIPPWCLRKCSHCMRAPCPPLAGIDNGGMHYGEALLTSKASSPNERRHVNKCALLLALEWHHPVELSTASCLQPHVGSPRCCKYDRRLSSRPFVLSSAGIQCFSSSHGLKPADRRACLRNRGTASSVLHPWAYFFFKFSISHTTRHHQGARGCPTTSRCPTRSKKHQQPK